ncbi:MAG: 50S ribosomal protein L11 methyltransferase, partial [Pseudomonadota bacterium]|nr:50S ribosomal protein L11 methyltransferase [Pseudomonadota bacterium]
GFSNPEIRRRAPYDLIICNMLAQFTVETAGQVKIHLTEGGIVILAGILAWMAGGVKSAYNGLEFEIIKEISISPWHCHILRRAGGPAVTKP